MFFRPASVFKEYLEFLRFSTDIESSSVLELLEVWSLWLSLVSIDLDSLGSLIISFLAFLGFILAFLHQIISHLTMFCLLFKKKITISYSSESIFPFFRLSSYNL